MSAPVRIGFVGPGVMGASMARRLLGAGHELTVYARTPSKVADLVESGAKLAADPREAAVESDVVIGCLRDGDAVAEVYRGRLGLLAAARPGQVFIEHGTVAPALARALAAEVAGHGARFLDVPVTGGPEGARDGRLTGIAGGEAAALATVLPLLRTYCAAVVRVGPAGSGLELKLINQLLVSVHVAAAAEAAALIGGLGLDADAAKRVLMSGWAASTMLDYCLPAALAEDGSPSGASIGGLSEVQELVSGLAAALDVRLPVFSAARAAFTRRVGEGAGALDLSQLARVHETTTPRPEV
jgi:3-hydroxyisobutyrate dehydrogenase-like beta-hydroxyacid dehydrogenase